MKYDLIIKNVNAVLENEIKKSDIARVARRAAASANLVRRKTTPRKS